MAKALARAGVASRRDVERYIAEGRVSLNGQVLDSPAVKVGPGDVLMVDGKVVDEAEPTRLWRYHKPVGLVTTHKDPHERPTVFSYLPAGMPRVISVGRLDLNSEGLLLLTNDGGLARSLELPSSGWVRRYRARARGRITQEKLDRLQQGITIEGVSYGPIDAKLDKAKEGPQGANLWITVGLTEGKNREVRRVLEHLGLTVNRLIRLAYGPFSLGPLASGEVEEVGPRVIRELLAGHIAPEAMPTGDRTPSPLPRNTAPRPSRRPGGAREAAGSRDAGDQRAPFGSKSRGAPAAPGSGPRSAPSAAKPAARASKPPARGAAAEDAPKMVYKPGWAKPKSKPRIAGNPGAAAKARSGGKAQPEGKAPGAKPQARSGPRPGARPAGAPKTKPGRPPKR